MRARGEREIATADGDGDGGGATQHNALAAFGSEIESTRRAALTLHCCGLAQMILRASLALALASAADPSFLVGTAPEVLPNCTAYGGALCADGGAAK